VTRRVVIDVFPESAAAHRSTCAIVAVDVIRATTTAVTAAAAGRRCFPVPTMEAALAVAAVLEQPLLAGELGGNMPFGFDLTNSPADVHARGDTRRPLVLLSSSGTTLIHEAAGAEAVYLGCLRNVSALVRHLAGRHPRVAVIGAGTRGEFREEDQACCALVAAGLMDAGYAAEDELTRTVVERWKHRPAGAWLSSKSVDYLRRSDQLRDLEFILAHQDDLEQVHVLEDGEVRARLAAPEPRRAMAAAESRGG